MKIEAYNPETGQLLSEDISGINFGSVWQGKSCAVPILLRLKREGEAADSVEMFLQNNSGYSGTAFGYYKSQSFVTVKSQVSVPESGVSYITDQFQLVEEPVAGQGVVLDFYEDDYSDYIWLDVKPGTDEAGVASKVNFRFLF